MADGSAPLAAILRALLFYAVAVVGPGFGLQRLARVRPEPALVVPLGLVWSALSYWIALVSATESVFPVLAAAASLASLLPARDSRPRESPPLRGAVVPLAVLAFLFALSQYGGNRVGRHGTFQLDTGEQVDTALHVGLTFELATGYPPEVPGFAGVPLHYHLGSHLVRAAAVRWAGMHPYDALSRFDLTLWAAALVLALRAAAWAAGFAPGVVALAGFVPLLSDLSYLPGLLSGVRWWALKLGGSFVEPLFFANSIVPAAAMAFAVLVAFTRFEKGEGRGFAVLAAALGCGISFFKVFAGAQLLLAFAAAWMLGRLRRGPLLVLVPGALALLTVAFAGGTADGAPGVQVAMVPFAAALPALVAFGIPAKGGGFVLAGVAWTILSLGVRLLGVVPAWSALRRGTTAARALGALALCGWPAALLLRITADPDSDESFYFLQASGLALALFALPSVLAVARRSRAAAILVVALGLPSTAEFVVRRAQEPLAEIPAVTVDAMAALREASCPGDVVLVRPFPTTGVPLPMVLAGRRVAFSNYHGYWRQFVSPQALAERERLVRAFFREREPARAVEIARSLGARFVYLTADQRLEVDPRALESVFVRGGERVYRLALPPARPGCGPLVDAARPSSGRNSGSGGSITGPATRVPARDGGIRDQRAATSPSSVAARSS